MIEILGIKIFYPLAFGIITLLATLLTIFSLFIHRKMVDQKRMEEIRKKMEEHQKRYMEAKKSGDKKLLAKLEIEQEEIMKQFKENMYQSFKPLFITTPVVLLLLWSMGSAFGSLGPILELPFGLPVLTRPFYDMGVVNGIDWLGWYIVVGLGSSLIGQLILKKLKGEKK